MKKVFQNIVNTSMVLCLILVNLYIPNVDALEDKTFGEVKKELQDYKNKYENNQLQQQLTEEEKKKTKENIKTTEKNISSTQEEIYKIKLEIEQLNKNIQEKEEEIAAILSFYQVSNGESAYLEYAFGAQDFTDFIYRVAVSEQLTSYNSALVEQYKQDIETSKKKSEELTLKVEDLEKQQKKLNEDLIKLSGQLEDLTDDAVDIKREIEIAESQIEIFTKMGCKDDETITECARNTIPLDTGFIRPLVKARITGYPGSRCICIKNDCSCKTHHGLDMSTSGADYTDYPVYSIANGIVLNVYYEYNGGKKVYIQHNINGELYVSAYWHLRRIDVEKGQVVTRNTQIGIMGGNEDYDDWSTGTHLHLELSTADFNEKNYYSTRANWLHPEYYINFPNKGVYWYERY